MELKVKLTDGAPLPRHAKPGDAGLDLTSRHATFWLAAGETQVVGTGVAVEIPDGYVGLCFPRSGLASKGHVNLANCVGVIDSGYRGEIMAPLYNFGEEGRFIERGERVFQLVVVPFASCECVDVDDLSDSERGEDGFGSTGAM